MPTLVGFLATVVVGFGATLAMDLWALFLERAFGLPPPDYCLVGRWVLHMPAGRFAHPSIAKAAPQRFECAVGWTTHYAIGAAYALMLVALAPAGWLAAPTLGPALAFGVGSVVVPFLVMHPAFGLGLFASRAPAPWLARLRSVMAHTVFGIGLYISAAFVSSQLRGLL